MPEDVNQEVQDVNGVAADPQAGGGEATNPKKPEEPIVTENVQEKLKQFRAMAFKNQQENAEMKKQVSTMEQALRETTSVISELKNALVAGRKPQQEVETDDTNSVASDDDRINELVNTYFGEKSPEKPEATPAKPETGEKPLTNAQIAKLLADRDRKIREELKAETAVDSGMQQVDGVLAEIFKDKPEEAKAARERIKKNALEKGIGVLDASLIDPVAGRVLVDVMVKADVQRQAEASKRETIMKLQKAGISEDKLVAAGLITPEIDPNEAIGAANVQAILNCNLNDEESFPDIQMRDAKGKRR